MSYGLKWWFDPHYTAGPPTVAFLLPAPSCFICARVTPVPAGRGAATSNPFPNTRAAGKTPRRNPSDRNSDAQQPSLLPGPAIIVTKVPAGTTDAASKATIIAILLLERRRCLRQLAGGQRCGDTAAHVLRGRAVTRIRAVCRPPAARLPIAAAPRARRRPHSSLRAYLSTMLEVRA